jgi:hypothetical protein
MTQEPQEKWQKALSKWDRWSNSMRKARMEILHKHGDLSALLVKAKITWPNLNEGIEIKYFSQIKPEFNKEGLELWNLYDEIWDAAGEFVEREIGLNPLSILGHHFVDYWSHSVAPELLERFDEANNPNMSIDFVDFPPVWFDSRVVGRGSKGRIIDRVSWYRGEVKPSDIAKLLLKKKWLSRKTLIKKGEGGRPREDNKILPEAVVCALLKDKQGLTYREITKIFGWSEPKSYWASTYSKEQGKKRISQTAVNRVILGREVLLADKNRV